MSRDDASTRCRHGTGPGRSSKAATTSPRASSSSGTTRGGAARRRSTAPSSPSSTTPARWSPPTRAARSTPSSSSMSCPAPRSSTTRTSRVVDTPTTNHRQIWMRMRHAAQFADKRRSARRSPCRSIDRRSSSSCSRARAARANDHVIWQFYPYFNDTVPSGPRTSRRRSSSWPMPGVTDLTGHPPVRAAQRDPGPRRPAPEPGRRRPGSPSRRPAGTTARSTTRSGATRPSRPTRPAAATPSSASSTTATGRARTSSSTRPSRRTASGTRRSTRTPAFDAAFTEFQAAVGVDAQKAACAKIETDHRTRTSPVAHPVLLQLPRRATRRSSPACTRARSARCSCRQPQPV